MPRYLCFEPPNEYFEVVADDFGEAQSHAELYGAGVICVIQTTVKNDEGTVKNDEVAS